MRDILEIFVESAEEPSALRERRLYRWMIRARERAELERRAIDAFERGRRKQIYVADKLLRLPSPPSLCSRCCARPSEPHRPNCPRRKAS